MIRFDTNSPGFDAGPLKEKHFQLVNSYNALTEELFVLNKLHAMHRQGKLESASDALQLQMMRLDTVISSIEMAHQQYSELLAQQPKSATVAQAQKHAQLMMQKIGQPARKLYDKGAALIEAVDPAKGPSWTQMARMGTAYLSFSSLVSNVSKTAKAVGHVTVSPEEEAEAVQMKLSAFEIKSQ